MKPRILAAAVLAGLLISSAAMADTDCDAPIALWQPREVLRQQLEQRGWTIHRIKVDDGCYEVKGKDHLGNKFKAKFAPDTLRIRELEISFNRHGEAYDYLNHGRKAE